MAEVHGNRTHLLRSIKLLLKSKKVIIIGL